MQRIPTRRDTSDRLGILLPSVAAAVVTRSAIATVVEEEAAVTVPAVVVAEMKPEEWSRMAVAAEVVEAVAMVTAEPRVVVEGRQA